MQPSGPYKISIDSSDFPQIPDPVRKKANSIMAVDPEVQVQRDEIQFALKDIGRRLGFVLDTETYAFRSVWEIGHWLSMCMVSSKSLAFLCPVYESEKLVLPFMMSLSPRLHDRRAISLTGDFDFDLNELREVAKSRRSIFVFSLGSPVTGAIMEANEATRVVHETGGIVIMDASYILPRRWPSLAAIDADITIVRSRPILSFDGLVIAYLSRRIRDILKGDSVLSSCWKAMSQSDIPSEQILCMLEALRYLGNIGHENNRARDLEFCRTVLDGIQKAEGLKLIGPTEPLKRIAIFSMTSTRFNPKEISLMLDNATGLIVSVNSLGVKDKHLSVPFQTEPCIRFAPFIQNTKDQVRALVDALAIVSKGGVGQ